MEVIKIPKNVRGMRVIHEVEGNRIKADVRYSNKKQGMKPTGIMLYLDNKLGADNRDWQGVASFYLDFEEIDLLHKYAEEVSADSSQP